MLLRNNGRYFGNLLETRSLQDWIQIIANFIEFVLDPDCKSPQNLGSGTDLD